MPRWKRGETVFEMSVVDDGKGSRYVRLPKPVDEMVGRPKKLKFVVEGRRARRVTVSAG